MIVAGERIIVGLEGTIEMIDPATRKRVPVADGLDGSVAVVTGGARNIGRAIALELAHAGCHIVVNAVSDRAAAARWD